ncbi:unnamed protein product [Oikopleura dioica]|uniref:cellulase n=1 Tax=Oikopleura dioica TaxID=34765 RepID=E4YHR0_OIKDI|nr:unnamed protein product [Oikopleura dioica]
MSGNYRIEMIFVGIGGAGKVESPNGRFLEHEFAYQGWSDDDNGSIYTAYSAQNLCWNKIALVIPISSEIVFYNLKIKFPFSTHSVTTWGNTANTPLPEGSFSAKSTSWSFKTLHNWTTGNEFRITLEAQVDLIDYSGQISSTVFLPEEITICLPDPVVPGDTGPSTTTSTSRTTTTSTTNPSGSTTTTSSSSLNCDQSSGIVPPSPDQVNFPEANSQLDYANALGRSILFYEAQISGELPSWHRVSWRGDSGLTDGCDVGRDLTGGFYDAGDFVKFNFPMAFTLHVLAWGMDTFKSGYIAAGEYENASRILKHGLDYFVKCHEMENGVLWAQVGDGHLDHASWGRPEEMTMARPSAKISPSAPGSDLAAQTAAMFAAGAMVFHDEDPQYAASLLIRSRALLTFASTYLGKYSDSVPAARDFYNSWSGYNDEIVLAAAFIAKASKKIDPSSFTTDIQRALILDRIHSIGAGSEFSWDDKSAAANLVMYEVLTSAGHSQAGEYENRFAHFAQALDSKPKTPGGMVHISEWGSARHAANAAFLMKTAEASGLSPAYGTWAEGQLNYLLGQGPSGAPIVNGSPGSLMIGHGTNFPQTPHHRSSSCPPYPEPCGYDIINSPAPNNWQLEGALVGGPRTATDNFSNDRSDYVTNEVALDYNAGFQGLLAAFV